MPVLINTGKEYYFNLEGITLPYYAKVLIDGEEKKTSPFKSNWLVSDKIPQIVTVITEKNEYGKWKIRDEYKHLNLEPEREFETDDEGDYPNESLFYEREIKKIEERNDISIEFDKVFDEKVEEPLILDAANSGYKSEIVKISPASFLVDTLIYPDLLLSTKSCFLSGDQVYKIVRNYIKNNYDPKYAKITSDYEFCFTVKKLLAIEPQHKAYNNGTEKRPKMVRYVVKDREVEVFEMTSPSQKYKGYTIMGSLSAKSHKALKNKLDHLLKEIIDEVNKPLDSCLECEGTGVVNPKKVEIVDGKVKK